MSELAIFIIGRDRAKFPWYFRVAPARLGKSVKSFGGTHQLGFAIARKVGKRGRFIVRLVEYHIFLSVACAAFGIFIPGRFLARKTDDQNIVPSIVVEIINEREKIV